MSKRKTTQSTAVLELNTRFLKTRISDNQTGIEGNWQKRQTTKTLQGCNNTVKEDEDDEISKGLVNDDAEQQLNLTLIDLPLLVGEVICKHCDRSTLLNLRNVCHKTKSWVESPVVLKKIPIELKNTKQFLTVLIESEVTWSNFLICCQLPQFPLACDFTEVFGFGIKVLNFQSITNIQILVDILLECPNLEVLRINDLNLRKLTSRQLNELEKNFENLKDLQINVVGPTYESDVDIFMRLATSSLNLTLLKLPFFHWDNGHDPFGVHEQEDNKNRLRIWLTKIVRPLGEYLKVRSRIKNRPNLKYLDIGFAYEMESQSFHELVESCYQYGTKLLNVMHMNLINILPPKEINIFSCIQSINGFNEKVDLSLLTNLKEMTWTISPRPSTENPPKDYQLEMPKLDTLNVSLFALEEDHVNDIVNKLFVVTKRPTVTTLKISWNMDTHLGFISGPDLCNNFPNLRTLEFFQWKGNDEQFRKIFQGIPNLEDLIIKDCRFLTDDAFTGSRSNPSPFKDLKKLQRLWIRSNTEGITDRSFQYAFWKVPIRHFSFHCIGTPTVTANGLSALRREPFKTTIEYITMDLDFWAERLIRNLKYEFKNLKRFSY